MVEINNQRKAFLDMLAWSEELITDVRKPEIMAAGYTGGELFIDYSDHLCKLVTLNPNSNQQAPDATSFFSRWWDAYRKQRPFERLLSEKSGRCGIAAD